MKHDLIQDYEQAQDSAGAAFSVVNLDRGERRAATVQQACASGQPLPKRRYNASEWRAEQKLMLEARKAELNEGEKAFDRRQSGLKVRETALTAHTATIYTIDAAIAGRCTPSGTTAPAERTAPETPRLMQRLVASPKGRKRATSLVGRLFCALKRRAPSDAEQVPRLNLSPKITRHLDGGAGQRSFWTRHRGKRRFELQNNASKRRAS